MLHRLKIISEVTPNVIEYTDEVADHEYNNDQLTSLEGIANVKQCHDVIVVFKLIIGNIFVATSMFQLLVGLIFDCLHECLCVKQFHGFRYPHTFNQIKEPTILKVKQRIEREQRHQVKNHGGFYVTERGFGQFSYGSIRVLFLVFEKELDYKVQEINTFNNIGYIVGSYQLFICETLYFELVFYYIGILQFYRFQSLLSDLFKKLSILTFGIKFNIIPKRCIKGVQKRAEYAYEGEEELEELIIPIVHRNDENRPEMAPPQFGLNIVLHLSFRFLAHNIRHLMSLSERLLFPQRLR